MDANVTVCLSCQVFQLLKHELEKDDRFQSFLQHCHRTRQQTQQTQMYFLAPPKQRTKSRYLNLEPLVRWAKQVLQYHRCGDFSQISEKSALNAYKHQNFIENNSQLTFSDSRCESSPVPSQPELFGRKDNLLGKQRFMQKLGWLIDYEAEIEEYHQLISLVHLVSEQVKQKGLNQESKTIFVENTKLLPLTTRARAFKARIEEYLVKEGSQIPDGQTLLGTSDIIESIFGKYKIFSSARPLKEIGQILLTIPVFTTEITPDQVKQAMESVRMQDVEKWAHKTFGQSMLSKRRDIFKEFPKK